MISYTATSLPPETRAAIEELRRYIEQQPLVGTHYNYAFIPHIINKRFEHCSPKKNVTIDKGIAQAQASKTAILATFDEICNHNDEKQLHIKKLEEKVNAESDVPYQWLNHIIHPTFLFL